MIRIGVTGTDTGVGKTVVSCALAAALVRRGLRVSAMKPVETGVTPDDPLRDGARLARAANDSRPLNVAAPVTLPTPTAPLVAARRLGTRIDLDTLDAAEREASRGYDVLIVEGAGGLMVPIADGVSYDGLFARWALDLLVVAANRLGVINHSRLTIAVAQAAGLKVRGLVLTRPSGEPPDTSAADNAAVLAELERVPVIELPWLADPDDLETLAAAAERSGLADLVVPAVGPTPS